MDWDFSPHVCTEQFKDMLRSEMKTDFYTCAGPHSRGHGHGHSHDHGHGHGHGHSHGPVSYTHLRAHETGAYL
eukprot:2813632-Pyramimonas_sp.AAC.1